MTLEVTLRKNRLFAVYIRLDDSAHAVSTREIAPSILAELDETGRIIGLEILALDECPTLPSVAVGVYSGVEADEPGTYVVDVEESRKRT